MLAWINKKRNKKGFTLVELVVVIAILGVLAALAVPRLTGSRANAARKTVVANLRTVDGAISMAEAEGKLPDTVDITNLKDAGFLANEPSTDGATYSIEGTGAAADPYRAVVTIEADNINKFGITNAVTNKTVEELQADATDGSLWK